MADDEGSEVEGRRVNDHELAEALRDFANSRKAVADAVEVVRVQRADDRKKAARDRKVALGVALAFAVGGWRLYAQHDQPTKTGKQLLHIVKRLDDALDPKGCIAQRGQASTALAVLDLKNDNRALHGSPTISTSPDVQAAATRHCAGDPAAP